MERILFIKKSIDLKDLMILPLFLVAIRQTIGVILGLIKTKTKVDIRFGNSEKAKNKTDVVRVIRNVSIGYKYMERKRKMTIVGTKWS